MRAIIENMISTDYVLCYSPRAIAIIGKKMEILEFTSKEAAAPLMSVAAPLWLWKFQKKIQNFGFFLQILKIMENFEKLRIIISNVGGKS